MKNVDINKGKLFVISAPSGAGKTTLVHAVIERLKDDYDLNRVITYTTKKPRSSEVHGTDYHFITEEEFKEKISQNFFVEHSTAYGAYYGFPRHILDEVRRGSHYIAVLDQAGAQALKVHAPTAVLIFIKPPNIESLQIRLATRAQDSEDAIIHRLNLAQGELEVADQNSLYHHVIVNDDIEIAAERLEVLMRWELE